MSGEGGENGRGDKIRQFPRSAMTRPPEELEAMNTESRLEGLDKHVQKAYGVLRKSRKVINTSPEYRKKVREDFKAGAKEMPLEKFGDWFLNRREWSENPRYYFFAAEFYLRERNLLKDEDLF